MNAGRVLALSLALALPARGQSGAVSLLVIDDATDAAVADVRVSIVGQPGEGVTDPAGRVFYVPPRAGRVAFVLRRLGYVPGTLTVDVKTADTARVTFALTVAPQPLATVAVRDTIRSASPFLGGFERRATTRAGSATFITRSEIDKAHANRVTDLLRRTTSLIVEDSLDAVTVMARRSGRIVKCPMQVAVDGELRDAFNLNLLVAEDIHGIEIYPGPATVPAEFASTRGTARCGLIMVWFGVFN
jgi:hypothetical protein